MRRFQAVHFICLFVWLGFVGPATVFANDHTRATVVKVYDGDTLVVRMTSPSPLAGEGGSEGDVTVRLIGIDCTEAIENEKLERDLKREKSLSREEMLEFGRKARELTETLCPPGTAVELEPDREKRDGYGRMLAYVWMRRLAVAGGQVRDKALMINAELLKAGLARTMIIPPNVKYAYDFRKLEREARAAKRGLWAE